MECIPLPLKPQSTTNINHRQRKLSSLNLKQRQYRSAKALTSLPTEPSISKQSLPIPDQNHPPKEQPTMKKYCLTKFRVTHNREHYESLRRNASLKILAKEDNFKAYNTQKLEESHRRDSTLQIKSPNYPEPTKPQSCQTIGFRRKAEQLIKRSTRQLRPSMARLQEHKLSSANEDHDTSFEHGLPSQRTVETDVPSSQQIRSENVLGKGLRKCSSGRVKVFVTNPFERHRKHKEVIKEEIESPSMPQKTEFKESAILERLQDSTPSMANDKELRDLLSLI